MKIKTNKKVQFIPSAFAAVTNPYSTNGSSGSESDTIEKASNFIDLFGSLLLAVLIFAVVAVIAFFLRRKVSNFILKKYGDRHQEIAVLYGRVVFTIALMAGVFIAFSVVGGASFEWFTGALGLGLAFSMRGIIANFFAGLLLLSNKDFNLGDFIILNPGTSEEQSGTIVNVQARQTTLRAFDGSQITIPNNSLITKNVKCFTRNPVRRHELTIGVGYGSNLKKVEEIILAVVQKQAGVEPEPSPTVLISEIGDSAVNLSVRFWTESHAKWWNVKSELLSGIFVALQTANIDIPYPVRTLRVDHDSSAILADHPDFLKKLEKIEGKKTAPVFEKIPAETKTVPATPQPDSAPVVPAAPQVSPTSNQN